jgi:hypothetical protein
MPNWSSENFRELYICTKESYLPLIFLYILEGSDQYNKKILGSTIFLHALVGTGPLVSARKGL